MKTIRALACLILVVIGGVTNVAAQPRRNCQTPSFYPRLPVQATVILPATPAQTGSAAMRVRPTALSAVTPPQDRFLLIDSVAVKGGHPASAYLAIELRTSVAARYFEAPPILATPNQQSWTRHFLYSDWRDTAAPLHIRENVRIYSTPATPVYIGVQSTAAAALEQMDVTVTGWWIDICEWGK